MDKLAGMGVITLTNNGPDIEKTNYWSTRQAKDGIIYFSVNAGCIRALVPESKKNIIQEMKTGKKVIISRGPFPSQGREDAFEILFDDYSNDPFVIFTGVDQWDLAPEQDDRWTFTAWTTHGKVYHCDQCKVRHVDKLPCLKPW